VIWRYKGGKYVSRVEKLMKEREEVGSIVQGRGVLVGV
jgi:hypothetical protein